MVAASFCFLLKTKDIADSWKELQKTQNSKKQQFENDFIKTHDFFH